MWGRQFSGSSACEDPSSYPQSPHRKRVMQEGLKSEHGKAMTEGSCSLPRDSCSSRHSERPCPQSNNQVESSRRWHPVPASGCSTCTHMCNACIHHPPHRIYVVHLKFGFNCSLSDQEHREILRAVNWARREHASGNKRGPRI